MSILSISSPPRPIIHKTFGYLTQLNLKSVGLGLNDIPYPFGWELMVYVGTIPCPIPSAACAGSSGLQDQFLENPETIVGDDSVPLNSQTGEKRKRVKMVARRTRTPRTRPQPRSRPSEPPSQPPRKSARIVLKSTLRTSKPSVPIVEEISSSTEGFSSSDSEDTTFKQGTPVFSESSEDQAPPKTTTKPAVKSSPAKPPLKRKPRTAPLPKATTSVPASKRPKQSTLSPMSDKHAQLLKRNVVRGKVVSVSFFEEQGLGCF